MTEQKTLVKALLSLAERLDRMGQTKDGDICAEAAKEILKLMACIENQKEKLTK